MRKHTKKLTALLCIVYLVLSAFSGASASAAAEEVELYIDGQKTRLEQPCVYENGTAYFPLVEVFFKVGVYMQWEEANQCWTGVGNNGTIRAAKDMKTIEVDLVAIELPAPTIEKNGVLMAPIYIMEDALKIPPVEYDVQKKRIKMQAPEWDIAAGRPDDINYEALMARLPEPEDLFDVEQMYHLQGGSPYMKYDVIDVEDTSVPFDKAIRLETLPLEDGSTPTYIYDIQMDTIITKGDWEPQDLGIQTFWARATKITDETGAAVFRACYEQNFEYYERAAPSDGYVNIFSDEWRKFYVPLGTIPAKLPRNQSHLTFSVGGKPQIIEVADMHIYKYPQGSVTAKEIFGKNDPNLIDSNYHGIEEDAVWRKEAFRRIEKYRKNDMVIRISDKNGKPVENAEVKADLTDLEFMHGYALVPEQSVDFEPDSRVEQIEFDTLKNLSNAAVTEDLKMKHFEDGCVKGKKSVNSYIRLGKRQRGHALAWDAKLMPIDGNLDKYSYQEVRDIMVEAAVAETWMFKDVMTQWDALNEPTSCRDLQDKYGLDIYAEIFKKAKAIDPKSKLYINDNGILGQGLTDPSQRIERTNKLVNEVLNPLRELRAPVDGIGSQIHLRKYFYPQEAYVDLNTLSQYVDEITETEYSFFNTDISHEGELLRDCFLVIYSHPKTKGFIIWGYNDKYNWRSNGPFFDQQWNKKPGYEIYKKLINETLSTHEKSTTDKNGRAEFRGHRGEYDITVTVGEKSVVIPFVLVDSTDTERDNWVDVVVGDNGELTYKTSSKPEKKPELVKYYDSHEAYADYLKDAQKGERVGVFAHSDDQGNTVPKTTDRLVNSFWCASSADAYVQYEFVEPAAKGTVTVEWRRPYDEKYPYKILKSEDGENWTEIAKGVSNDSDSCSFENAMFIRIQSDGGKDMMQISDVSFEARKAVAD